MLIRQKLAVTFLLMLPVCAFTRTAEANTNEIGKANINVVAPSTDPLTLEQVPDIEFGKVKYQNALQLESTSSERYQTLDLRGQTNAKYTIQVEVSDFQAINSKKILPMKEFLISVGDSADGTLKGKKGVNVYKVVGTVAEGVTGSKRLENSGPVSAKLILSNSSGLEMGDEYTATLTHRIIAGV